jgi:hypothetical protein
MKSDINKRRFVMKPKAEQMQLYEGWIWGALVELRHVSLQDHWII